MKTAISIPDQVFEEAEKLANELQVSRSKLYTQAVQQFIEYHEKGGVTGALNRIYGQEESTLDEELAKIQQSSVAEKW